MNGEFVFLGLDVVRFNLIVIFITFLALYDYDCSRPSFRIIHIFYYLGEAFFATPCGENPGRDQAATPEMIPGPISTSD